MIRRVLAASALVMVALTAVAASATSVHAEPDPGEDLNPPCEWEAGGYRTDSDCDGELPSLEGQYGDVCWADAGPARIDAAEIWAGGRHLADVVLWYDRGPRTPAYPNGACRTTFAVLMTYVQSAGCYAKIERNSDRQAFYTYQWNGTRTPVVYDADVTSYAWATCRYDSDGNGQAETYSAGTRSY